MKKLNALAAAISLGLTASFAALPVASAHSTHYVGHSHTAYAHQKHILPKSYERFERQHISKPDFSKFFEVCERITPVDVTPIPAVVVGTSQVTVATINVPRYCDNSIALGINATYTTAGGTPTLTCKLLDENNNTVGSPSSQAFPNISGFTSTFPLIAAEIAKNFPAFYPGGSGYYGSGASYTATGTSFPGASPLLQTEAKTVSCSASAGMFTVTSVDGQVDSQAPSQFVVYSLPAAPYSNYAADTYTQMSNLENPAHHHGREGSLQKGAIFYTNAECKSSLQAALAEKDNQMDAVLPQQSCFP